MIALLQDPLQLALGYARRGWQVFPCHAAPVGRCTCARVAACDSPAKHPRTAQGCKDATTDAAQIEAWWSTWPDANVAIATGRESGLVVIDVDPRHGGRDSLARMQAEHAAGAPVPLIASTGGGGVHLYFRHPGDPEVPNRVHLGGYSGVDLRGDGGYVIAPPSVHASGNRYGWKNALPIRDFPPALLELAGDATPPARQRYERPPERPASLPLRAKELLRHGDPRIRRRFDRDATGLRDRTPSGVDCSLGTLLAKSGLRGDEIEVTLRESRARAGLPGKRDSYWRATVGRALAVGEPLEPR